MNDNNKLIIEKLKKLNNAQLGSFGEYCFEYIIKFCYPEKKLELLHSARADFLLDGERIDVKTTIKNIANSKSKISIYNGKRIDNTSYAKVDFFLTNCSISIEKNLIAKLNWPELIELHKLWKSKSSNFKKLKSTQRDKNKHDLLQIKNEILDFFKNKNIKASLIYRTTQFEWGKESPDNLIPKNPQKNKLRIFISFHYYITPETVDYIICIPENKMHKLELISTPKLHKQKIDLDKISIKYRFSDIADLLSNYNKALLQIIKS